MATRTGSSGRGLLVAATVLGGGGVALAAARLPEERFWTNWVYWFVVLFTVGIGSLFIVALQHLVSARWSIPVRRVPERLATLLLPVIPVGLTALLAVRVLYPGAKPEALHNKVLAGKAFWLGLPFVSVRTAIVLAVSAMSLLILVRGSLRQDKSKDPRFSLRARRFAPGFMVLFAFLVTLVAFDWISALTPEWYSDIFGVYLFAGSFLSALAATAIAVGLLKKQQRLTEVRPDHLYNVGGFMFAFTVFWSYIGFAQYMLMWYANLPEEVEWYHARLEGGWYTLTVALAVLHFVVPFFALLTRDSKGDIRRLLPVGLLMLGAHLLDMYWLIFPALEGGPVFSWPELSFALLFIGGSLLWLQRAFSVGEDMPVGDPLLQEGLEFRL
jgi:hypothetical protein